MLENAFRLNDSTPYNLGTQKLAFYLNTANNTATGIKSMTRLVAAP